jgi:hypothetical protein
VSDFSGLEQSFVLSALAPMLDEPLAGSAGLAPELERSYDVQLADVDFRRLHAADELHAIQQMRAEIQLPGTAVADAAFMTREKKETGRGWSVLSSGMMLS